MAEGTITERREQRLDVAVGDTNARLDFYHRAESTLLAPLWKVLSGLVTPLPRPRAVPHHWRYAEIRPFLNEACALVTAAEAERRVMLLENPALPGQSRVLDSLFAGFQIILPGETAPAHRHVAAALRFIIEGSDAYTAVDGERTIMRPGDFVATPSWVWHDHAAFGSEPMVWLDGLDMHIVNLLSASFREEMEESRHGVTRPDDSSSIEFGYALAPVNHRSHRSSPILNYPYVRTREALDSMASHSAADPCFGHMVKYLNPLSGDWAISTLAAGMRLLPAGFETAAYRATDSTVFVVVEGRGQSEIDGKAFTWQEHDVIVAPSWTVQRHRAFSEAVLFSYSDRAVQEKLGFWREERLV